MPFKQPIRSTIIITLGPACTEPDVLGDLMNAGVHLFRINFSHGSLGGHRTLIRQVRQLAEKKGLAVALLGDLSGPKIRVGKFKDKSVILKKGDHFTITSNPDQEGTQESIGSNYPYLTQDVKVGDRVLLNDGKLILVALAVEENGIQFEVHQGGELSNHKGMNLPGIPLSITSITDKDKQDFQFMIDEGVDFAALSFVRQAEDIQTLKRLAGKSSIKIIAKIEKPEAIADFNNIMKVSDGIMIARGDLGVEMPLEKVPVIQKDLISRCHTHEVPVITATQMLDSMIHAERPTRAETTDVFNAILDQSDAVMLSGETATGDHPLLAVQTMQSIAREAENLLARQFRIEGRSLPVLHAMQARMDSQDPATRIQLKGRAMAHSACQTALDLGAKAIVTLTKKGNTARRIANYHPPLPIIALCPSAKICQQLNLFYGVYPVFVSKIGDLEHMFKASEEVVCRLGLAASGDLIVIVAGFPFTDLGHTNLLKMHVIP